MEELREKANIYAEENTVNVLKEAFAKVYSDGYRDGYKDCEEKIPIDLCENQTEYVDLGLPSGTLWASDYEKDDEEDYLYLPYCQTSDLMLPTEEQWNELLNCCEWQGDYSSSRMSLYGVTCIGPNGNSIRFRSKGYVEGNATIGIPYYGGGEVYFWLFDNEEGNKKKAVCVRGEIKEIKKLFSGCKVPVRLVKTE